MQSLAARDRSTRVLSSAPSAHSPSIGLDSAVLPGAHSPSSGLDSSVLPDAPPTSLCMWIDLPSGDLPDLPTVRWPDPGDSTNDRPAGVGASGEKLRPPDAELDGPLRRRTLLLLPRMGMPLREFHPKAWASDPGRLMRSSLAETGDCVSLGLWRRWRERFMPRSKEPTDETVERLSSSLSSSTAERELRRGETVCEPPMLT